MTRSWVAFLVVIAGLLLPAAPASARIFKTILGARKQAITVGSGLEFETDDEHTQYDLPLLVEYGFAEPFTLTIEPNYVILNSKTDEPSASGWGDLETTLTWDVRDEYRKWPALSFESTIKWPTAQNDQLGTGKTDYSMGIILSKTHRALSLDANAIYTWAGRPEGAGNLDVIEGSLAMEWAATYLLDLETEIVTSTGAFHGRPGNISGIGGNLAEETGTQTEATLGIAEHPHRHLKLEQGGILKSDGSWQLVFAWEWDSEE